MNPKSSSSIAPTRIYRTIGSGTFSFASVFFGFEKLDAVRKVFGSRTKEILTNLKVEVFPKDGYMGVSDEDGHIFASQTYINTGETWCIYLDVVHELVHVKQFMMGKELFDQRYSYVDRPTEIEAYQVAAREARRIGMSEQDIFDYLKVPWISTEEHHRLALACAVPLEMFSKQRKEK